MAKIDDFRGGTKSQRDHLKKLVAALNDAHERIAKLEAVKRNPLRVRVNNRTNTRQLLVELDALIISNDDLFCCGECTCSGSDGAHGGI